MPESQQHLYICNSTSSGDDLLPSSVICIEQAAYICHCIFATLYNLVGGFLSAYLCQLTMYEFKDTYTKIGFF